MAYSDRSRQSLTAFLRKRDPRYKSYIAEAKETSTASAQVAFEGIAAARRRAEASAAYIEQPWQRVTVKDDFDSDFYNDDAEEWECVACDKTFRTEAAWVSHERTRKHMKALSR
jgi:DnaJ homolog subfamily A member 5